MTYRDRRERRADRREEWAAGRRKKQAAAFDGAKRLADAIPFGQPILVGHHSEKRARRDAERITSGMTRGVEHGEMASHHGQAADTIRRQLDTSIYRDDLDELERLEEKLAELETKRARIAEINKWVRKNRKRHGFTSGHVPYDRLAESNERLVALARECHGALNLTTDEVRMISDGFRYNLSIGIPSYAGSNLSGNISRTRKRIENARERAEQRRRVQETLDRE